MLQRKIKQSEGAGSGEGALLDALCQEGLPQRQLLG